MLFCLRPLRDLSPRGHYRTHPASPQRGSEPPLCGALREAMAAGNAEYSAFTACKGLAESLLRAQAKAQGKAKAKAKAKAHA